MANINVSPPKSKYRAFQGNLRVLAQENPFLYRVEVALLNDITNRNNWRYENLEEHRALFADTPILVAYVDNGRKIGDGHNFKLKKDRNGEEVASFTAADAERIVGWFPSEGDIRIENRNGTKWVVGTGHLWSWYANELTEMLSAQGAQGMEVSIETLIETMRMDGSTEVFEKYKILGTTILGAGVTPAVAGARIRKLSDLSGELEKLKIRVANYEKEQSAPAQQKKTTTKTKGVTKRMSKKTLAELQAKFDAVSQGAYRVLATSDDGLQVCLMSADGIPHTYEFASKEDMGAIVAERINRVIAPVAYRFDAGEVAVDVSEITETLAADIVAANAQAEINAQRAEKAEDEMQRMKSKESARRIEAAKNAAKTKLGEINSIRKASDRIDEKECDDILADCDAGKYTDLENADGAWIGDARVAADVSARCMDIIVKVEKRNEHVAVWDAISRTNGENSNGIAAVLAHINE